MANELQDFFGTLKQGDPILVDDVPSIFVASEVSNTPSNFVVSREGIERKSSVIDVKEIVANGRKLTAESIAQLLHDPHFVYATRWREHLRAGGMMENEFLFPIMRASIGNLQGQRTLDAGCGDGWTTPLLTKAGAKEIHAIDLNPYLLNDLHQRVGLEAVKTTLGDVTEMPYEEGSFDTVLCKGLLMNMDDDTVRKTLLEIARVLSPGGKIVGMITHPEWLFVVNEGGDLESEKGKQEMAEPKRIAINSLPGVTDYYRYRRPLDWYEAEFSNAGLDAHFSEIHIDREVDGMGDRYRSQINKTPVFAVFEARVRERDESSIGSVQENEHLF